MPSKKQFSAAYVKKMLQLSTLDRLKFWQASYCGPAYWIGYSVARDNGEVHPRWRCCAQFALN